MANKNPSPIFLNLFRIRFPVGAVTSIAHRLSGILLFFLFPVLIYLLDLSLRGPEQYQQVMAYFEPVCVRLPIGLVLWALFHHLFAGIRFLMIDLGIGVGLRESRISAWLVNLLGFACLLIYLRWAL